MGNGGLDITPEELRKELVESYDVFLTWTVDDYFRENFSSIFSDPDSIADQSIYKVNKEKGLLELVGDK